MKKILRSKFRNYIRENKTVKAAITKHIYSLAGITISVICLVIWGADLIFVNHPWPEVKIAAIFIAYGGAALQLYYDCKTFELKKRKHDRVRTRRSEKNQALKPAASICKPTPQI